MPARMKAQVNKERLAGELKVGIVGCGHIATTHISALKRSGKCQVSSVCDKVMDRSRISILEI